MRHPVIAVYSGTFDPLTLGHDYVVRRAAPLFDTVVLAVARALNPLPGGLAHAQEPPERAC